MHTMRCVGAVHLRPRPTTPLLQTGERTKSPLDKIPPGQKPPRTKAPPDKSPPELGQNPP